MPKKAYISFQIQVTKDTTTCLEQWQTWKVGIAEPYLYGDCPKEIKRVSIDEKTHLLISQSSQPDNDLISEWNQTQSLCNGSSEAHIQDSNLNQMPGVCHDLCTEIHDTSDEEIIINPAFLENPSLVTFDNNEDPQNNENNITVLKTVCCCTDNSPSIPEPVSEHSEVSISVKNRPDKDFSNKIENQEDSTVLKDLINQILQGQNELKMEHTKNQQSLQNTIDKLSDSIHEIRNENQNLTRVAHDANIKIC